MELVSSVLISPSVRERNSHSFKRGEGGTGGLRPLMSLENLKLACACSFVHVRPGESLGGGAFLSHVFTLSSRSRSPRQDPEASLCLPASSGCFSWTPPEAQDSQMSPGASTEC